MDFYQASGGENNGVATELISCTRKVQLRNFLKAYILCVYHVNLLGPTFGGFCSHLLTQDFSPPPICFPRLLEISSYLK